MQTPALSSPDDRPGASAHGSGEGDCTAGARGGCHVGGYPPSVAVGAGTLLGSEASSAETRRLLRASFEAMAKLGFQAGESQRDQEDAMAAFRQLATAASRAHFEHTRRSRPQACVADATDAEEPVPAPRSGCQDPHPDFLADALEGLQWEPGAVLGFLYALQLARRVFRKRIKDTALVLTQLSPTYQDAVASAELLARWLGTCPAQSTAGSAGSAAGPLVVVSYGYASSMRWAAWDASWHWASLRKGGRTGVAEEYLARWEQRREQLAASAELPRAVSQLLLDAVWMAAQHCAMQRWPEQSGGLGGWISSAVGGNNKAENCPLKGKFEKIFAEIAIAGVLSDALREDLQWLAWNMCWHVANRARGYKREAQESLVRAERHLQRSFRSNRQWRGVNLGGWFLIEPGPSTSFWQSLPAEVRAAEKSEWGCCQALGPDEAARLLKEHRRTYYTREDFDAMRAAGLTHVRLPFGAWCVHGPRPGEPYIGPCLEALDKAVNDIEAAGLHVLLDLHGTVGGESAEPPCGRDKKDWHHSHWDPESSLAVLSTVAKRYASRACVCAIGVANEPAESIPAARLARYYEAAVEVVREAGMRAGEVAVVLPIFTEMRVDSFLKEFEAAYERYEDCVFDVHFYQCFGVLWQARPLERQMADALKRQDVLRRLPACCVSEWSLQLPCLQSVEAGSPEEYKSILKRFATQQLAAYETATHGWFFWTWKDSAGVAWCMRQCLSDGLLAVPSGGRASDLLNP